MSEGKTPAQLDAEALYIGNLNTVEFSLKLPDRGPNGSAITWKSGNTRFLHDDGTVVQPQYGIGSRNVELTATFRDDAAAVTKKYTVHVLEAKNDIQVREVRPIRLTAERGKPFYLPAVAIIRTGEGDLRAHPVTWENGLARCYTACGRCTASGVIAGTEIPVTAEIEVRESVPVEKELCAAPAEAFAPGRAVLEPGSAFWEAQCRSLTFLRGVNDDRMLYNFRFAAGLDTRGASPMIGWDAPDSLLRGHTTGHYLSALALCYEATAEEEIRRKAEYLIAALGECQDAFSRRPGFHEGFLSGYSEEQFDLLEKLVHYPEIWAPYYTLHKILAGLLDCAEAFGSAQAEAIAEKLGLWVYNRLSRLTQDQRTQMWGLYIAGEFGGMNEVLAELYLRTKDERYLTAARMFDNDKLFYPMEQNVDTLNGMHANQHIPQVIGAMRMFEATGEARYHRIARNFWRMVTQDHIYAIGGTGEGEMFHQAGRIARQLSEHTAESCASYNMLKLTKELYACAPDAAAMDYYERTMLNHILSSGEKKPTGASTYFLPLAPGFRKTYDDENSCCHGTGLENHFKYAECIYFHRQADLYVNLFINSRLNWQEQGCTVCQQASRSDDAIHTVLRLEGGGARRLLIRRPAWCSGAPAVSVDGRPVQPEEQNGFLLVPCSGSCTVECRFGCALRLEAAPDEAESVVLCWGPYVLAGLTDSTDFIELHSARKELAALFVRQKGEVKFILRDSGTEFIPLCEVEYQKYQVYVKR